jgi:hypothetical protein
MRNRIICPCDDDHFASSEIELEASTEHVKGVVVRIHAQFGDENYAFLHPSELDFLIKSLLQMKELIQ